MEELKTRFKALSEEEKVEFMKAVMPDMYALFRSNPQRMMQELMPLCREMMPGFQMDANRMMQMMFNADSPDR